MIQLRKQKALVITGSALLLFYTSGYYLFSEIHHGIFKGTPIKLRLFQNSWEVRLWAPLLQFEQWARKDEFYGHVRNGASLPPGDPAFYADPAVKVANTSDPKPVQTGQATISRSPLAVYTVRQGDSLQKIADQFDISLSNLVAVNRLRTEQIRIGQELRIPKNPDKSEP